MISNRGKILTLAVLSIVYVLSGKLGLMLALPPGYASAIFPPAGIAVVAVLIGGRAAIPWIFSSALILNLWIGFDHGAQLGWLPLISAVLIAVASTLQALLGSHLLRKYIGYPMMLGSTRELVMFGLLAPVTCLVSATISVGGLAAMGVVPLGDAGMNWLSWWLGDMLGVLMIVPLVLVVIGEPRGIWRSRVFSVTVPMVIMLTLLVAGFVLVNQWEQKQSLGDFDALTRKTFDELKLRFELQESLLGQTQALFSLPAANGTHKLTRDQFRHFAQAAEKRFSAIQAISWAPRISHYERAAFEAAQRHALPAFELQERDADGKLLKAAIRKFYQPVTYIEPLQGNELAVGFDLASNPARLEALRQSEITPGVVATAPIRLVQEKQEQAGILLIQSVRGGKGKSDVVTMVLRMGDFMSQVALLSAGQMHLRLIDVAAGKELFSSFAGSNVMPMFDEAIVLATREYRLQAAPTEAYLVSHRSWQSWIVLVVGLFATSMLGGLLLLGTGQKAHAESLVEERTRELRKRDSAFANAQQIANVGSWEWNIVTGDLAWSDEIYRIFGLAPQQFAATYDAFLARVHPDDVVKVTQAVDRALKTDEKYFVEHRVVRPSGEERFVEEQGLVERDQKGVPVYMLGVVHDITERKQLDRMKSEFISTVSHELRTPLTSIRGSLGLLAGQMGSNLPAEVRNMLELADRNSERLAILINDLLDLEKIESGQFELEMKVVELVALVRRSIEENGGYAQNHGVALKMDGKLESAIVQGDVNRLLQVLANLISNAVKFSPENGAVEISIVPVETGYRILICDHGSGIPDEFRSRIFGRFAQADSSDTRKKGGTGLGLAISKIIVENHGGRIGYGDTPGGGTTFWFELPAIVRTSA